MPTLTRTVWGTPTKTRIRAAQLDVPGPLQNMLTLPGPECLDIKHLINTGCVTVDTSGVAVEYFSRHAASIRRNLRELPCGTWQLQNKALERVTLYTEAPLDFAYLDMCTAPTAPFCGWLRHELAPVIKVGGHIAITLLRPYRRNPFMAAIHKNWLFAGTSFWTNTRKQLVACCNDLSEICVTLGALVRVALSTCTLVPEYVAPYTSDSGTYMLALRYRVTGKVPRAVDQVLLDRTAHW